MTRSFASDILGFIWQIKHIPHDIETMLTGSLAWGELSSYDRTNLKDSISLSQCLAEKIAIMEKLALDALAEVKHG